MNPYSKTFRSRHSRRQSQNIQDEMFSSNTTYTNASSFQDLYRLGSQNLPLRNLAGSDNQIVSQSIDHLPNPFASPQPYSPEELTPRAPRPGITAPVSRRPGINPTLLTRLGNLDIQPKDSPGASFVAYEQNADTVADPDNMPIGNSAQSKGPPTWGVIKISNIPYSITRQEIFQFLGRKARIIRADQGCPVHIIMERSTAKTMDCYVEVQTAEDAEDIVKGMNEMPDIGRGPRLGNRHVDVNVADQNELLRNLFPLAKCIEWKDGIPFRSENDDPHCSDDVRFFTGEEVILAIRHAESPNRSPFSEKCPQRTYESTISTLHKFPWYATRLYTVEDRNQLFKLANHHIIALSTRIKEVNTVGLNRKLLNDLLQAGLKCPAFNDRQKYTLCMHSEIQSEINKLSVLSKWFPFDTLARKPDSPEELHMHYAYLISQGVVPEIYGQPPNTFPQDLYLRSPYGRIWFEWPEDMSNIPWETAVGREMVILSYLVFNGWYRAEGFNVSGNRRLSEGSPFSLAPGDRRHLSLDLSSHNISPHYNDLTQAPNDPSSCHDNAPLTPIRRASESAGTGKQVRFDHYSNGPWDGKLLLDPFARASPSYRGHRNTKSSPCLPSPSTNPWWNLSSD